MAISKQFLESLLYEDESSTLDFKRDQYSFEGATNDEKSELLKDILAFANSWRHSDAYILIGVEDVKGGCSIIVGIAKHLDDAKLQQFVNSKTQRPVHFSYLHARLDNQDIGVIHIPLQERPIYIKKNFGKLKKEVVYIRRNSSTDIASPDEIARMGQVIGGSSGALPLLELQFVNQKNLEPLGNFLEAETVNLSIPDDNDIPEYGLMKFPVGLGTCRTIPSIGSNSNYYRDIAHYLKNYVETYQVNFLVNNAGSVLAEGVCIEIQIDDLNDNLILRDENGMPDEPSKSKIFSSVPQPVLNSDLNVRRSRNGWIVTAELGKIQPKASAHTNCGLYIGAKNTTELKLVANIFADNLPSPKECELSINLTTKTGSLSVDSLIELSKKGFLGNVADNDE